MTVRMVRYPVSGDTLDVELAHVVGVGAELGHGIAGELFRP